MEIKTLKELMKYCIKEDTYVKHRIDEDYIMLRTGQILKFKEETYG